jgi:ATP-dependent Clp protease ATP-binding subunit ClpA
MPEQAPHQFSTTPDGRDAVVAAGLWGVAGRVSELSVDHLLLGLLAWRSPDGARTEQPYPSWLLAHACGVSDLPELLAAVAASLPAGADDGKPAAQPEIVSPDMEAVFTAAEGLSENGVIDVVEMLAGIIDAFPEHPFSAALLERGLTASKIIEIDHEEDGDDLAPLDLPGFPDASDDPIPEHQCEDCGGLIEGMTDLTQQAREGRLDPVVGRDEIIGRVITILSRRTKNSPVLLGLPGTGKTAIAEGLAQRIAAGDVPEAMRSCRLLLLSPARLVAGAGMMGEFEERVLSIIDSLADDRDTILFIDEMHTIVGAGTAGRDRNDLGNMLKPALARGQMRVIGATTAEEYRAIVEGDAALERRFEPVRIPEPTPAEASRIITALAPRYAGHHNVSYTAGALRACVSLAVAHMPARFLPDKAIDLLDEAGAAAANAGQRRVTEAGVRRAVAARLSVDVSRLESSASPLDGIEDDVVGQPAAVAAVRSTLAARSLGISDAASARACLIFAGPAGTGKTVLAKAVADRLYRGAMTVIDLAEYGEAHSVSGLIGSPPGYVGFDEPARLVEPLRTGPARVLLLEHADLAHPAIRSLLADALRSGSIADTRDRRASLRDAVVILTVTLGAGGSLGFARGGSSSAPSADRVAESVKAALGPAITEMADEIAVFAPLDAAAVAVLADRRIRRVTDALAARGITLSVDAGVRDRVMATSSGGGRAIRRAVERLVERPLAASLGERPARGGARLEVGADGAPVVRLTPRVPGVRRQRPRQAT